jgi:hypothetical protein
MIICTSDVEVLEIGRSNIEVFICISIVLMFASVYFVLDGSFGLLVAVYS